MSSRQDGIFGFFLWPCWSVVWPLFPIDSGVRLQGCARRCCPGSRHCPAHSDLFGRNLCAVTIETLLRLNIRDVSSGFRCFRREVFEKVDLDDMISAGPAIVLEILYKVCLSGFKIKEVPIVFRDRRQGDTKLDTITLLETLVMVLRLRKLHRQGLLIRSAELNG